MWRVGVAATCTAKQRREFHHRGKEETKFGYAQKEGQVKSRRFNKS